MRRPPVRAGSPRPSSFVAAAVLATVLAGCGLTPVTAPAPSAPAPAPRGSFAPLVSCSYVETGDAAKPATLPSTTDVPARGTVAYTLQMTGGRVTITMDRSKAPCTVNSFTALADQGYFDGTRCHRLSDSGIFITQCGDPSATGAGGPGYTFADETTGHDSYRSGVVAMANSGPNTNGSQFFLVWADSTGLDARPNYTVFGTMDRSSRDVVAQMAGEGQDGSQGSNGGRPNNPTEIAKVTRR